LTGYPWERSVTPRKAGRAGGDAVVVSTDSMFAQSTSRLFVGLRDMRGMILDHPSRPI
jgi:hypothetical protein